jgi:hypothetical protein
VANSVKSAAQREKLAAALRENLKRRKARARAAADQAAEPVAAPPTPHPVPPADEADRRD